MATPNSGQAELEPTHVQGSQKDEDIFDAMDNMGVEEEMVDENREKQQGGEGGEEKEDFDSYEFGDQEEEETVLEDPAEQIDNNPKALKDLDGKWMDGEKTCTARINAKRRYLCVDFPALVKNKDKALQMLGGKDGIEKTLSRSGRLELYFRPNDPFCKPTVGTGSYSSNLLMKIRRRKAAVGSSTSDGFEYQIEVLGVVDTVHVFDKPCDFQYLPVSRSRCVESKEFTSEEFLSDIRPVMDTDRSEYLARPTPLFLPPAVFSRRERPCSYDLENDVTKTVNTTTNADSLRKKREHGSYIIEFKDEMTPTQPLEIAKSKIERFYPGYINSHGFETLIKIFEERPLWSKIALKTLVGPVYEKQINSLLPMVAYCFHTGPWRNMWCKFGFDPRTRKEAKVYQVLDYRIRTTYNRSKVLRKRQLETGWVHSCASTRPCDSETSLIQEAPKQQDGQTEAFNSKYMYRPDTLPPYRQMRYQLCDILEDEVQRRVHENDGMETECTERDGWCVPDIAHICRDIINAHVNSLIGS